MLRTALIVFAFGVVGSALPAAERPNILWLTSEDNGPHLGAYGDAYAVTPHLDALAARSLRYTNAWSDAPVCAPARTCIITGVYPPSLGAEHMRSMVRLPEFIQAYPQLLREAGYYCTNNSKEDYNLELPGRVWDESSRDAHWKNRAAGQPFFAIFNFTVSHESQLRKRPHTLLHDPAHVRIPAYHPDTPEVRHDWAQYYDKLTEMDAQVGNALSELEEAGLSEDTIVFYYGDHGSGMPRNKRWPYNSGLNVPLIVHIPAKFRDLRPAEYAAGESTTRLVSFVDLAPTLLSLLGLDAPQWMQGRAFLGTREQLPRDYLFGFRGRMDERLDMVRSVRDERYVYIRNYMPHKIYGQYIAYMFQTPTTRVWSSLFDAGNLSPPQTYFWEEKPVEELYDLHNDRDEVHNLADSPEHQAVLERLRRRQREWSLSIRDLGFLPEDEVHRRSEGQSPYEMARDAERFPIDRILPVADLATRRDPDAIPELKTALGDDDSAVRYWAAVGLLIRKQPAWEAARAELRTALEDPSPSVRVVAAEAVAQHGTTEEIAAAMNVLLTLADAEQQGLFVAIAAWNAIDALDGRAAAWRSEIAALPEGLDGAPQRLRSYVPNLKQKTLADLESR